MKGESSHTCTYEHVCLGQLAGALTSLGMLSSKHRELTQGIKYGGDFAMVFQMRADDLLEGAQKQSWAPWGFCPRHVSAELVISDHFSEMTN